MLGIKAASGKSAGIIIPQKNTPNFGTGLKESVKALTRYLNTHNNAHKQRAFYQYQRALNFDTNNYKN